MAFNAGILRVETPASTGNVAYTGLGFQPKVIIVMSAVNSVNNGTIQTYTRFGMGAAASTSARWAAWTAEDDNHGSGNTRRAFVSDKVVNTTDGSGTAEWIADLVSLDADGFTLNWSNTASSGYEFYFLCLGGDDLSVKVGTFDISSGTGSQAVTGVGFQPDCVLMCFTKNDTTEGQEAHATFVWGMGDGTRQNTGSFHDNDANGDGNMHANRIQNNDDILNHTFEGSNLVNCELSSLDADGFTINRTTTTETPRVGYIALAGIDVRVDQFTGNTSTGVQTVSGVGFTPKAGVIYSVGTTDEAEADDAILSMGFAISSSSRVCMSLLSEDGLAVSNCEKQTDASNVLCFQAAASKEALGDFDGFASGQFGVDWTTVDANARIISYLALGEVAAPAVGSDLSKIGRSAWRGVMRGARVR